MIASPQVGILCAGSIVQDTIIGPFEELRWGTTTFVESMVRHLGGNGANTARALALLGNRVRLAGAIGNDDAASFALTELRSCGIDTSGLSRIELPNAATAVLVNGAGDRQFLHRLGSSQEAFREPLEFTDAIRSDTQHFHLASLFVLPHLRKNAPEMLRTAKAIGLTTSLDTNWDPLGEWLRILEPCLRYVDILFLNQDESRMLTGTLDPAAAAAYLQVRGADIVVQKLGGSGCAIFAPDVSAPSIHCAPFDIKAVDSTGAGDCFAAGFLSAFLRGESLSAAGENGNAAGALSVSAVGSVGLLSSTNFAAWKKSAMKLTG